LRIDGHVYEWLGEANLIPVDLIGLTLTPTSTRFSMKAAGIDMNITFLSPLEVRQILILLQANQTQLIIVSLAG
jgi:hypothetical protein